MVGTTTTTATCTADWRVALSPQYQTSDGAWHGGTTVFNHIYYPAFNAFYNGGTTHTQDPACCILYWDDGDGTENFVPLCRYPWRIHAGYWTPTDIGRAKVADAYSEPTVPTCSPPLAPVR